MPAPDVARLPIDELRAARARARRSAELARLRSRQVSDAMDEAAGELAALESRVRELTDELIARYSADLSLVDSLLGGPYPADGTRRGETGT